jgi:hypothetical protein
MLGSVPPAVALALALGSAALADSLTASASVDPDVLTVGSPVTLIIEVGCTVERTGGPVGTPEVQLPDVPQLGLTSDAPPAGQSARTSASPDGVRLDAIYKYQLVPSEAGTFDLPPIAVQVTVGGRRLSARTHALRLAVGAGDAPRRSPLRQWGPKAAGPVRHAALLALAGGLMLAGAAALAAVLIFTVSLRRRPAHEAGTGGRPRAGATVPELRQAALMGDGDTFYAQVRELLAMALGGMEGRVTSAELASSAARAGLSSRALEQLAAVLENADHVVYGGAQATALQLEADRERLLVVLAELGDRIRA